MNNNLHGTLFLPYGTSPPCIEILGRVGVPHQLGVSAVQAPLRTRSQKWLPPMYTRKAIGRALMCKALVSSPHDAVAIKDTRCERRKLGCEGTDLQCVFLSVPRCIEIFVDFFRLCHLSRFLPVLWRTAPCRGGAREVVHTSCPLGGLPRCRPLDTLRLYLIGPKGRLLRL